MTSIKMDDVRMIDALTADEIEMLEIEQDCGDAQVGYGVWDELEHFDGSDMWEYE